MLRVGSTIPIVAVDGDYKTYIIESDGSKLQKVTISSTGNDPPAWSLDGNLLLVVLSKNHSFQICAIKMGEMSESCLTDLGNNGSPSWSPDGQQIAFASNRDGNNGIFVMDANGQNQRRLTDGGTFEEGTPSWSARSD